MQERHHKSTKQICDLRFSVGFPHGWYPNLICTFVIQIRHYVVHFGRGVNTNTCTCNKK
jgi:hypothetical protein